MMEIIKFDRIVSVNNEIQGHGAQNLLEGEIRLNKNWMCEKGTEKAMLILQLERAAVLNSIHVGNAHSAFVEILVGTAAGGSDEFESLVPMSSFMNPHESKTGTNPNRTRFFNKEDFNESAAAKCWDRIKVVCTQPFNKHVPYGLCFLKVHGDREGRKQDPPPRMTSDDGDEIEIGSFFKKRNSRGEKPPDVGEQIKESVKESLLVKHTPISIAKISARMKEKKSKKEDTPKKESEKRGEKRHKGDTPKKESEKRGEKRQKKKEEEKTPKKRKREKKKKKPRKAFGKLMEDVVLVISGFQNPLRGIIRSKALAMGAKYSADWESHCTHLVCAYENTPKFNQVKGKGRIVKKEWVEKCHEDKRRYPWRRFALSKSDTKSPESEEEIEAGEDSESEEEEEEEVATSPKPGTSKEEERGEEEGHRKVKTSDDEYDVATDEEEGEECGVDTSDYPMPYLPDLFASKTFYVDPNLRNRAKVERYIVAYSGILAETFDEGVQFLVTEKGGAPLELFKRKAPDLVAVKPSWIWDVNSKERCTPTTPHLVT